MDNNEVSFVRLRARHTMETTYDEFKSDVCMSNIRLKDQYICFNHYVWGNGKQNKDTSYFHHYYPNRTAMLEIPLA